MDLKELFAIVQKRSRILLIIALAALLTSSLLNIFILDKVYTSTVTLMINSQRNEEDLGTIEYDDILLGEKLVDTYSIIAKSDRVMEKIIRELELDSSIKELSKKIIVRSQPDKRLLEVTVKDNDPQGALDKANIFLEIFQGEIDDILQVDNVQVINIPKIPISPTSPNILLNLTISVFAGIIIGLILLFFVEYLEDTIKSTKEVRKKTKLPIIARILKIEKSKSAFGETPEETTFIPRELEEAIIEMATNLKMTSIRPEARLMLMTSSLPSPEICEFMKGLSIILSQLGKKVIVLDCDFQNSDLSEVFHVQNDKGLVNILKDEIEKEKNIQFNTEHRVKTISDRTYYRDYAQYIDLPNLTIIPTGFVKREDSKLLLSNKLTTLLMILKKEYDIILVNAGSVTYQVESLILAQLVDEIILFEGYGQSTFSKVRGMINKLESEKSKIMGLVLHSIPPDGRGE